MAIAAASPNSKASLSSPRANKRKNMEEEETAPEMKSENPKPQPKKRNSNPGVRVIHGKIYDSQNGTTCHQCRQKTYAVHAKCKNQAKVKPCTVKYCRTCLLNRYGEKVEDVELLEKWDCPRCKGLCNCSFCMKRRGHQPTGMLVQMAKAGGFSSVSDLIDVKGVENVSNYKRAKETTDSPRKLGVPSEDLGIKSPKKVGKENLFDGKRDTNADPLVSISTPIEKKPKKVNRKGSEVKLDGSEVNVVSETETNHALNENSKKKLNSKGSKAVAEASVVDQKPKKMKRKGVEVKPDGNAVTDVSVTEANHALNEKKQKKLKTKGSKETPAGNTINDPISAVNSITETNHAVNEKKQKKLKAKGSKETTEGNTVNGPISTVNSVTEANQKKQKKLKGKGSKETTEGNTINGPISMVNSVTEANHALNEKKQKKLKAKVSKETTEGNTISGPISTVNTIQPENEKEKQIHDQNANQQLEDNQSLKAKNSTLNLFETVIPLPTGTEMVTVAGIDLPKEDVGNALQLLEFCHTFGKIVDVKKGQAEAVLRDIFKGRSTRRGKFTSVIQFHIQLLSVIQEELESESGSESESSFDLTHGNDSWLKALKSCMSKSKLKHMDSIDFTASGYDILESSMKLRLLVYLCDEVLGTEKVRSWIDEQNVKFAEKKKEAREKLSVAKDKEKTLKQKMQDDVAKAIIAKEGAPLTIQEHDDIVSKIKSKAAEAHAEMLACKGMVPIDKARPDAMRIEPIFRDNNGHMYWRLKGCSEMPGILLQDVGSADHTAEVVDKWFEYDDEQMAVIEKHINVLRSRLKKHCKN